jgi:glucuronosyltransferase
MNWLREEKFDLAFSHMYDLCVIGIIHHVRIPTWIWLNSGALMDPVAVALGVPSPPSYVPRKHFNVNKFLFFLAMMMDASGDNMPFTQRLKSFLGHTIFSLVYSRYSLKFFKI